MHLSSARALNAAVPATTLAEHVPVPQSLRTVGSVPLVHLYSTLLSSLHESANVEPQWFASSLQIHSGGVQADPVAETRQTLAVGQWAFLMGKTLLPEQVY